MTAQTRNKAYGDLFILKILEHFMSLFPGNINDFKVELQPDGNDFLRLFVKDIGFVENLTISGVPDSQMIKFVVGQLGVGTRLEIWQVLDEKEHFDVSTMLRDPDILFFQFTNVPELIIHYSHSHFGNGVLNTLNSRYCNLKASRLQLREILQFLEDFMNMKTRSGMGWWRIELEQGIDTLSIRNWMSRNKGTVEEVKRDYTYRLVQGRDSKKSSIEKLCLIKSAII